MNLIWGIDIFLKEEKKLKENFKIKCIKQVRYNRKSYSEVNMCTRN